MMLHIPGVLGPDQLREARALLDAAEWVDGNVTSGYQSALAKRNMQLPEDSPLARQLGQTILAALGRTPLLIAAARPLKIFPPLFNRYQGRAQFDTQVDNALRVLNGSALPVRRCPSDTHSEW